MNPKLRTPFFSMRSEGQRLALSIAGLKLDDLIHLQEFVAGCVSEAFQEKVRAHQEDPHA